MKTCYLRHLLCVVALGTASCTTQSMAKMVDGGTTSGGSDLAMPLPFQADTPETYVAKVKTLLVGLPPTDAEVAAVKSDPNALAGLVDQWMKLPQYDQKMMVFFELAFQQTQIGTNDFVDVIPKNGLGNGSGLPFLIQNVRESFARTALGLIDTGAPITDGFTTKTVEMTTALLELYAFMDQRQVDDTGAIKDAFNTANKTQKIYFGTASGPIPIAQSIDSTNPNYMHWYAPDVATVIANYPDPTCMTDPIVYTASSFSIHQLLYGAIDNHTVGTSPCGARTLPTTSIQFAASDFTDWRPVTIRPPKTAELTTTFYDLPSLRTAQELVVNTPHPGFFSTPAFFANWPTNTSNQMRVTVNQALIVATGHQVDGNNVTNPPATTPGLDAEHAAPGSACFSCHQFLDPTRSILAQTYSWFYDVQTDPMLMAQPGLFAFDGQVDPVSTIDDFANELVKHPEMPAAWVQKLCYYLNSAPCAPTDPEFLRIVKLFSDGKYAWNPLVKALVTSPITTHTAPTGTSMASGEVIAVSRRDHLCAALNNRIGLIDVCGLDATIKHTGTIPEIVSGLPSDGYGRGSTIPVLPNQPTLFYRAGLENICEAVSALVVDPAGANVGVAQVTWSSKQPDQAIAAMVSTMLGMVDSDERTPIATTLLKTHFSASLAQGENATNALRSTFITACLTPSFIGIGM